MPAHLEWLGQVDAGILRIGPEMKEWGDPYEFSCVVVRKGDTAMLLGAYSDNTTNIIRHRHEVKRLLGTLPGIRWAGWTRLKDGERREVRILIDNQILDSRESG